MSTTSAHPDTVSALILAGGRATRMGGVDKGLVAYQGRALIEHVIERIRPQVDDVIISANRNVDRYAAYGYRVVGDSIEDYAGPLAGLAAGIGAAHTKLVVCVACDMPGLPTDLVGRLRADLGTHDAAVAASSDGLQPVVALYRANVLPRLNAWLAAGNRKAADWLATLDYAKVMFDASAFANLNRPEDLI